MTTEKPEPIISTLAAEQGEEWRFNNILRYFDNSTPEPKQWWWGRDYGKDLLADINQMAHWRDTNAVTRDILQRAYREISRLRKRQRTEEK